jgi:indolepyruvate ferredoxin oxidoreductase alpha subunit
VFDPATPDEAKAMVAAAFDLSEQFGMPVILRPTTRVCHAIQNITLETIAHSERKTRFKKDPSRWAATPRFRYVLHKELNEKLRGIESAFEESPFNRVSGPAGEVSLGIIAAGACSTVVLEVLAEAELSQQVPVLRIGTAYPLPQQLVADFVARCGRVVVLEEPDAAIELQIRDKRTVSGRMDGVVPSAGELTPEVIYKVLAEALAQADIAHLPPGADPDFQAILSDMALPPRIPQLCAGCGHRSAFFAIKRTFPGGIFPGDIGCYTLGTNQLAVDTVIDMGAAISVASGLYHAYKLDGVHKTIVATIGDSTFIHSGMPGLADAAHNGARFVLVILDNDTTAMTGMQPTAQNSRLAFGTTDRLLSIEQMVRACGVAYVYEADPYDYDAFTGILQEAEAHTSAQDGGVAVVIAKRACVLFDPSPVKANPMRVEITEDCDGCKYCLAAFGCPAMVLSLTGERVDIDRKICIDCGECIESCYKGFIVPEPALVDLSVSS